MLNARHGALARALGGEAGVRTTVIPHGRVSADFWYLHLDSELVWNGDEGGTDASGRPPLRRRSRGRVEPAAVAAARRERERRALRARRNPGNGSALALAPTLMGQGGVTLVGGDQFVALRARGIADRPGNDDDTLTAAGYLIFDLMAGRDFGKRGQREPDAQQPVEQRLARGAVRRDSRITPTAPSSSRCTSRRACR